jgi:outer membrane protein, multidrug efflux system
MRVPLRVVVVVAIGGCALQSPPPVDELRRQALPNTTAPAQWTAGPTSAAPPADAWLAAFDDPALTALVAEALAYNADLRIAVARVEQAAGYVRIASATLYPAVDLLGRGGGKLGGDASGLQGVLISASWELDVWGRVRYVQAAAIAQQQSTEADYRYARASIAALVAKSWFLASEARQQRSLAARAVADGERLLSLAGDRERIGRGDSFDVAIASASVESYRDALRQADLAYVQSLRALEALLGRYPAAALEPPPRFATMPANVSGGIPSELLERRPDVIAAERRVAAAFNRIGEAKAAMLPRFALTAGVSSLSSELFVLKSHDNPVWSLGANIVAPLFQGGALRGNVEVRTAEQEQAIAEYARVAQRAFGEVESALSSEAAARDRVPILSRASAENARAVDLAGIRLRVGSGDLRGVLQQQLALYGTQAALLRAQGEQLVQRVNLYLALGGDFGAPGSGPSRDDPLPAPIAARTSGTRAP